MEINHNNCYATKYGHLDRIEPEILINNPDPIIRGQQISIMGNTGFSSGTHLHFILYKDPNCDGDWSDRVAVDPYGWSSSNTDPWEENTTRSLWIPDLRNQSTENGSGSSMSSPAGTYSILIPPEAATDTITIELSAIPQVAESSIGLRSTGHSFGLRVFEWLLPNSNFNLGQSPSAISSFQEPISITANYTDEDILHLDEDNIAVYRWDNSQDAWIQLPTSIDAENNIASALTMDQGQFILQAPLLCNSDDSEPNDNFYSATHMSFESSSVSGQLDIAQDEDWFKFYATRGQLYHFKTTILSDGVEIYLEVFDTDGVTLLATSDLKSNSSSNSITWQAPEDGLYYMLIDQTNGSEYGCDSMYSLSLETITRIFMPLIYH